MSKIKEKFELLKKEKRKAFIPYITCGYPNISFTEKILLEFNKLNIDIIELGIPFSDPLADGPTIQKASQIALLQKITLEKVFNLVISLKDKIDVPLVLMSSFNPIYKYGVDEFIFSCKKSKIAGFIIPDLPPEEAKEINIKAKEEDIDMIFLLSPTSSKERIKLISQKTTGFIYYISVTGVTGARKKLPKEIEKAIKKIRKYTNLPICVGFGISKPAHLKTLSNICDGVIVGSAIIDLIEKNKENNTAIEKVITFCKKLIKEL